MLNCDIFSSNFFWNQYVVDFLWIFFFQYRKKKWNAQIFKAKRNARGLLETNLFFFFSLKWWVLFLCCIFLFFKVLQVKMCCQNTKRASNKNVQNSAPCDLKRTNCTINLQLCSLVFTILVYMVSGDSLTVFFVRKFRVFHIYVSQNSMWTYICPGVFGPGKKWDSLCYYWKSEQNI